MMSPEAHLGALSCAPETKDAGKKAGAHGAQPKLAGRRKTIELQELPPPGVTRWVIRRKAQVVAAVQAGIISLDEVCSRYSVSVEEFQAWQTSLQRHGLYGLRTTRSQIYRSSENPGKNGNGR